jgi:hypothetical protein
MKNKGIKVMWTGQNKWWLIGCLVAIAVMIAYNW